MRKTVTLSLALGVCALAVGGVALRPAKAADMALPEARYDAPPPGYYPPPPMAEGYAYPPPPPAFYGYPPPPSPYYYAYGMPPYAVLPGPYYGRGPYWRGYAPRFAHGYGHWGRGYRR